MYSKICEYLKPVFHELDRQRGSEIVEGRRAGDHVYMRLSIPPKYAVSEVVGKRYLNMNGENENDDKNVNSNKKRIYRINVA